MSYRSGIGEVRRVRSCIKSRWPSFMVDVLYDMQKQNMIGELIDSVCGVPTHVSLDTDSVFWACVLSYRING